ncbi:MAG: hypothetical protein H6742_13620 [Alphaproteobacteria bacterium]|nr:hypothetical protein [Alphaproteobacteria bacterium]
MLALLLACASTDPAPAAAPPPPPAAETPAAPAPDAASPEDTLGKHDPLALYGLRGVDYACAPCQGLPLAELDDLKVSSYLDRNQRYAGSRALDGDLQTAWCEGAEGPGVGQTLRIVLRRPLLLEAVGLWGGYFKDAELLAANARVKTAKLTTSAGTEQLLHFADPTAPLARDPSLGSDAPPITDWYAHMIQGEVPRLHVDPPAGQDGPFEVTWLQLEVVDVYPGSRYADLCISELDLLVVDPREL